MKNFVSFNAKFYKHSNASGEIGHVQRAFAKNKNAIDERTPDNFYSTSDLKAAYDEAHAKACKQYGYFGKGDANTFLDACVNFSREQVDRLREKHGDEKVQRAFTACLNEFGRRLNDEFGFKCVGWGFHMDEGHTDPKTGKFNHNYHAQMILLNFDEKNGRMPLRKMKLEDWSKIQDLAGECFKRMGMKRGISKEITQAEHLEKDEFIKQKHAREMQEASVLSRFTKQLEKLMDYFEANNEKRIKSTEKRIQKTVDEMDSMDWDEGLETVRKYKERTEKAADRSFNFDVPRSNNKPK